MGQSEDPKTFVVHKNVLCEASSYFEKGLATGRWQEGDTGVVKLSDVEPIVLAAFIDWLYTHSLPDFWPESGNCSCWRGTCVTVMSGDEADFSEISPEDAHEPRQVLVEKATAINLYIFADRFDVPELRQQIVDRMWWKIKQAGSYSFSWDVIFYACQELPDHSRLNRLMRDTFVSRFKLDYIECRNLQALCLLMPPALWVQAFAAVSNGRPKVKELCTYHEHDDTEDGRVKCRKQRDLTSRRFCDESTIAKGLAEDREWR